MFIADNDYHKAKKQLEFCEENSDVPSDLDTALKRLDTINTSRIRKPPNRYCNNSDSESSSELLTGLEKKTHKNNHLSRPPMISGNKETLLDFAVVIFIKE